MAVARLPETGTLVIAALLLLVLGFAGYWIIEYANPRNPDAPWELVPWFLAGGALIVTVGIIVFLRRGSGPGEP
jgi:hypothetical protein